ncbi:MAG: threonylcarbamoyl-AMP synthase [Myxococcales bacterium FL481]|nr:MAG: threonylcarbamoyl-AMP synthase [Myxococcales bacterium FL481]
MSTPPDSELARAVDALVSGHVIGLPTETVYGLAADATNAAAVRQIFALKGRPAEHPVIVHVADASDLERFANRPSAVARQLARRFWPGPLTLIVKRTAIVPGVVTGGRETVGIRAPSHPCAQALLRRFARGQSGAVAAPSANRFGGVSPTTAAHVREEFGDQLGVVLDGGACEVGIESTIVDVSTNRVRVLRPGHIGLAQLQDCLGVPVEFLEQPTIAAPGTLASHYAPNTPVTLGDRTALSVLLSSSPARLAVVTHDRSVTRLDAPERTGWFHMSADPSSYARELYDTLRRADRGGYQRIFVLAPPKDPRWLAVNDRLQRAAHPRDPGE